ncbi:MAG: hypothetical protein ACI8UD_000415 [Planctomycetota bacterium]|jgi:hypothetical protein
MAILGNNSMRIRAGVMEACRYDKTIVSTLRSHRWFP